MVQCTFSALESITLFDVENALRDYSKKHKVWMRQYGEYFWVNRLTLSPSEKTINLLELVSGNGWNMNRQGQCKKIIGDIKAENISQDKLNNFWTEVDKLSNKYLLDLPNASEQYLSDTKMLLDIIRQMLYEWHVSAGTICFLTKVILMFNWGQSPAFDSRVRNALGIKKGDMSTNELMQALIDIGCWIIEFENKNNVKLDEFSANVLEKAYRGSLRPLPIGRSFDILLFSL